MCACMYIYMHCMQIYIYICIEKRLKADANKPGGLQHNSALDIFSHLKSPF